MVYKPSPGEELHADLTLRKAELSSREKAAFNLADQNADDTSCERNFPVYSDKWYTVFANSYQYNWDTMDNATIESWDF